MRRLPLPYRLLSLAALLTALLPAACARAHGTGADAGAPSGQASGSSPATTGAATGSATGSASGTPAPADGCPDGVRTGRVSLSEADNGKQVCLATGTSLELYLHGTADSKWSAPTPDGTALRPTFSGKSALPVGVTAGFFIADRPGVAHLNAHRPACPATSGGMACQALISFQVTILVR